MLNLTSSEQALYCGDSGNQGEQMSMQIVVRAAEMLGANQLIQITSSHIG